MILLFKLHFNRTSTSSLTIDRITNSHSQSTSALPSATITNTYATFFCVPAFILIRSLNMMNDESGSYLVKGELLYSTCFDTVPEIVFQFNKLCKKNPLCGCIIFLCSYFLFELLMLQKIVFKIF